MRHRMKCNKKIQ